MIASEVSEGQAVAPNVDVEILKHRVGLLEQVPPRVEILEQEVTGMKRDVHLTREEVGLLRGETAENTRAIRDIDSGVKRLFWTGAGVFIACSALLSIAAVIVAAVKNGVIGI